MVVRHIEWSLIWFRHIFSEWRSLVLTFMNPPKRKPANGRLFHWVLTQSLYFDCPAAANRRGGAHVGELVVRILHRKATGGGTGSEEQFHFHYSINVIRFRGLATLHKRLLRQFQVRSQSSYPPSHFVNQSPQFKLYAIFLARQLFSGNRWCKSYTSLKSTRFRSKTRLRCEPPFHTLSTSSRALYLIAKTTQSY